MCGNGEIVAGHAEGRRHVLLILDLDERVEVQLGWQGVGIKSVDGEGIGDGRLDEGGGDAGGEGRRKEDACRRRRRHPNPRLLQLLIV